MSVPNYKKENGNQLHTHTYSYTPKHLLYVHNTKVPHVCVQRYMLCAKCRFAPSLDLFCAKSEDGANSHFAHNNYVLPNVWCSVQYRDSQVGSDGDLGEGEEEEGGGAGLGMGDVLGGVVTLDVTVGGARCECV